MENLRYYTELHWMDRWCDWRSESVAVMTAHYEVPVLLCVGYLAIIFGLQRVMRHRQPFDLSGPLFWWNVVLALFSIFGALAVVPPIVGAVRTVGASFDMCHFGTEVRGLFLFLYLHAIQVAQWIGPLTDFLFLAQCAMDTATGGQSVRASVLPQQDSRAD